MFKKLLISQLVRHCKCKSDRLYFNGVHRKIHMAPLLQDKSSSSKDVVLRTNFENISDKNKNTYLEMVKIFQDKDFHRRGHVEFIYSALKNMKEFDVHKDLEVYKAIIDTMPKGKFIPENIIQAEFMHYPKQQQCMIDLLEQMEDNGVMPDCEIEEALLNTFGRRGYPLRKFWRMMYWMPKFKNLSPWPLPNPVPDDVFELAKLAVQRMCSVDIQSKLTVYETAEIPEALEDTWIVSSQSISQQNLLDQHNPDQPIYVEGSYRIWIKDKPINYFILRGDSKPFLKDDCDVDDVSNISIPFFSFTPPPPKDIITYPSVHEQEDGLIFAVCVTGSSGRDSLLSWIRHLEKDGNPKLSSIPVVFKLLAPHTEIAYSQTSNNERIEHK